MDEPPSQAIESLSSGNDLIVIILSLASIAVLLLLSTLAASSESLVFSLKTDDLRRLGKGNGENLIPAFSTKPYKLLTGLTFTRLLAQTGLILVSISLLQQRSFFQRSAIFVVTCLVISFVVTFFLVIVPRTYAIKYRDSLMRYTMLLGKVSIFLISPVSKLFLYLKATVEKHEKKKEQSASEELAKALELIVEKDNSIKEEKEILKGVVNFSTLSVKQVMQSRIDIAAVNIDMDFHRLMDCINKFGFSRIPVYSLTIDKIEGILYIKDLLPFIEENESFNWISLLRPAFFVPVTKKVDSLLNDFQEKHVHIAIVVDEYGATQGLITLEDIIEEIIGEINDEFDEEAKQYQQIDEATFVFEGKVLLNDFCKIVRIEPSVFEKVRGESESLGGLLLELNNELPAVGKKIQYRSFTFIPEAVDRKRIKRIRVKIQDQQKEK